MSEKRKRKWDIAGPVIEQEEETKPEVLEAQSKVLEVAKKLSAKTTDDMQFVKDIDINDHKARYQLTSDKFIHKVKMETQAEITVKGKYYPDAAMATKKDPPLYLHVEAPTEDSMRRAMEQIDYILDNKLLPILDQDLHGMRGSSGRVHIGILHADNLNVRTKVLGPNGAYLRHIMLESGTKCHLRGKGSGFIEPSSGKESEEELYIYITGNTDKDVAKAKELCKELLVSVRRDVELVASAYLSSGNTSTTTQGYNQYALGTGDTFLIHEPPAPPQHPPPEVVKKPPPPPRKPGMVPLKKVKSEEPQ